jgi:hypothetical protein
VLVDFDSSSGGLVERNGTFIKHAKARRRVVESVYTGRIDAAWLIEQVTLVSAGH